MRRKVTISAWQKKGREEFASLKTSLGNISGLDNLALVFVLCEDNECLYTILV
jgi:hypothetical protein